MKLTNLVFHSIFWILSLLIILGNFMKLTSVLRYPFFWIPSIFIIFIVYFFLYRPKKLNRQINISTFSNAFAWILFFSIILFIYIYGRIYPFQYYTPRPYDYLISAIPLAGAIIFALLAFLGTSHLKLKFGNWIARLLLTVIHCIFAFSLYICLIFFTCSFYASECCC